MTNKQKKFFILIPIIMLLVLPFIVMLLWNNVVVDIFRINAISYLQALGLFVLCRLLFGNFGFGNRHKSNLSKQMMGERMMNLSDEDKCRMKEEWKKRIEKNVK